MTVMNYQQAWDYLDQLQFFKIKLGLDSMNRFLGKLGNPHRGPDYVHIGGTNGKGSVGATLLSILTEAGYRAGLYTSPHLSSVRERFKIGDSYIAKKDFSRLATNIREILNGDQITYFEFTTTLALLWFAEQQVDLALLEVGMGGRLDATNVVVPLVSIITNVSMDHEQYLGDTLTKVATEKAGIIKPNVPLVTGVTDDVSREVVIQTRALQNSPCFLLGRDFQGKLSSQAGRTWTYTGLNGEALQELPLSMKGDYQVANASLALATLEQLQTKDFTVSEEEIRSGLQKTRWPGRLEEFWLDDEIRPFALTEEHEDSRHYLLDGAHNPAGVTALKKALKNEFFYKRLILIWASMSDKDLAATLHEIAPMADTIIFTRPEAERSATPESLQALLPSEHQGEVICTFTVEEALQRAAAIAATGDLICVAGSLYLVGRTRQILLGELVTDDD